MGVPRKLTAAANPLNHLDGKGEVHIVDISHKDVTSRQAVAESWVQMLPTTFEALVSEETPKGDVLATVRLAAIMAVKRTSDLIPLCHPLAVENATCQISFESPDKVRLEVSVSVSGKTGVEMEALTGASVAALTLYDMVKALDKSMTIGPTRLVKKTGGKSGDYQREVKV